MRNLKKIKKEVRPFLMDSKKKKIKIKVPNGFKVNFVCNPFGLFFIKFMLLVLSIGGYFVYILVMGIPVSGNSLFLLNL